MASGVNDHIWHKGGGKTVCTSHVLAAFDIPSDAYHYSGTLAQRSAILRKFGFAVRSRASRVRKCRSVGQVRKAIMAGASKWGDPPGTRYMLRVRCGKGTHAMLLDEMGNTIVDTAPRKRDRREVLGVHAVFRKS